METPQNQKQALRRLNAISKLIPLEHFYSITITRWGNLSLQGDFSQEVALWATLNRFKIDVNRNMGYVCLTRGKIEINLL
jgi:hypothetical protein